MVASMSGPGPVNAIKRSIIDGKSVILLEGPPQVLSWNEFKSICKLFEEVDWFDITEVTDSDFSTSRQVGEAGLSMKELSNKHGFSKETVAYLSTLGIGSTLQLSKMTQDDISHLKLPMGQKRKVADAVAHVAGRPVPHGSFHTKSSSSRGGRGLDGALAEHPKFWADHMSNSKLIKLL